MKGVAVADQDTAQNVPVKVYQSDDRLMVAAPMPGLEPQDLTIEVTRDNNLVMRGDARGAFKDQKIVHSDEWDAGPYIREVPLPTPVDGESANVTYHNGVIVVALPVVQQTRAATLRLERISSDYGERVGHAGHPIRPRANEEHETQHNSRSE